MGWLKRHTEIAWQLLATNSAPAISDTAMRVSRRQAVPAAADSYSTLKAFVENAPGAIAMLDRDLRFLQVSNRWLKDSGDWRMAGPLRNVDVIGRQYQDVMPDTSPKWIELCKRCLEGHTKRNDGQRFVRTDGRVQWNKWEVQPWRDANGLIGGVMVMTEDITTLKLTEERLSSLTAKMQAATSGSGFGIWEWEIGSDHVWIDRQGSSLIGCPHPDSTDDLGIHRPVNGSWFSVIHPDDKQAYTDASTRAVAGEVGIEFTYRILRQDTGELRHICTHFSRRTDAISKTNCLVAVSWDVTKAAETEAALLQSKDQLRAKIAALEEVQTRLSAEADMQKQFSQKLAAARDDAERARFEAERANQSKSAFLANMSHELRTPLNAIIGFSEVLKTELFGPVGSARYREYAADIYESGSHLLGLINDVLDISKIDADHIELSEEELSLLQSVTQALRVMEPQAAKAKVRLINNIDPALPLVLADRQRIRQVLLNLLSNAVKFTPAGGEVTVSNSWLGDDLVLTVSDTGIGMAPGEIPKALERFGQVENTLTRRYKGTGLGLPLAKHLIELHGGTLTIESKVDQGTKVMVLFPRARLSMDAFAKTLQAGA